MATPLVRRSNRVRAVGPSRSGGNSTCDNSRSHVAKQLPLYMDALTEQAENQSPGQFSGLEQKLKSPKKMGEGDLCFAFGEKSSLHNIGVIPVQALYMT